MIRATATGAALAWGLALFAALVPPTADAGRWEVRQEVREGAREVRREKREARREIRRDLRNYDDDGYDRDGDVLKGLAIRAAVVGIATAVSNASRDDD